MLIILTVIDMHRSVSDHVISYVVLDAEIPNPDTFTRPVWLYNNGDYDSMKDELEISIINIFLLMNVSQMYK